MGHTATIETPQDINVSVDIHFSDPRLEEIDTKNINRAVIEQAIIEAFETNKISQSEVGELLGITTLKAEKWLSSKGVDILRELTPEMKKLEKKNLALVQDIIGITQ